LCDAAAATATAATATAATATATTKNGNKANTARESRDVRECMKGDAAKAEEGKGGGDRKEKKWGSIIDSLFSML